MIRRRLGWPLTDAFVTDEELFDMIRESQKELFDFMVSVHHGAYRLIRFGFPTEADRAVYLIQRSIDGTVGDLVGLAVDRVVRVAAIFGNKSIRMRPWDLETDNLDYTSVAWDESTDLKYRFVRGLRDIASGEQIDWLMYVYPPPSNVVLVEIVGNIGPGTLSLTDAVQDLENDEYIVLDGAIKCLQMEETDPSTFIAQKERLIQRLTNESTPLDEGKPLTIQDVRGADTERVRWWW